MDADNPESQTDSISDQKITAEEQQDSHYRAAILALFVTVLWSSSWVIIKFGLEEIPPLTYAGVRYFIAAMILMGIIAARPEYNQEIRTKSRDWWKRITLYGIIFVAITQGSQFVGLELLEAITVSLLLNLTPLVVLILGAIMIHEVPKKSQVGWILIGVGGVLLYFYPANLDFTQTIGLVIVLGGVLSNALSSIMGRSINRQRKSSPIVVTGASMTIGASLLLVVAFLTEGINTWSLLSWFYILWLSVVNTAFAFTLWNKAMQTLRAIDITIINSTMMPQIVILSILFLGEMPDILDWVGLFLIGLSALVVQISQARKKNG